MNEYTHLTPSPLTPYHLSIMFLLHRPRRKTLLAAVSGGLLAALLLTSFLGCSAQTTPPLTLITEEALPLSYQENGEVKGVATDTVRQIMERLDVSYEIQVKPWSEGYELAQTQPNTALFATVRTPLREDLFQWAGPIASYKYAFFRRAGSGVPINMLDDARRVQAIAVYADDSRGQYLAEQGFTNLVTLADEAACLRALAAGEVDLAMTSDIGGFLVAERAGLDPADFEAAYTFNEVQLYVAFQKDTPKEVVQSWQAALDEIRAED